MSTAPETGPSETPESGSGPFKVVIAGAIVARYLGPFLEEFEQ